MVESKALKSRGEPPHRYIGTCGAALTLSHTRICSSKSLNQTETKIEAPFLLTTILCAHSSEDGDTLVQDKNVASWLTILHHSKCTSDSIAKEEETEIHVLSFIYNWGFRAACQWIGSSRHQSSRKITLHFSYMVKMLLAQSPTLSNLQA